MTKSEKILDKDYPSGLRVHRISDDRGIHASSYSIETDFGKAVLARSASIDAALTILEDVVNSGGSIGGHAIDRLTRLMERIEVPNDQ